MKKILVTGCNGYIGSHVVTALAENGHDITGWDINIYGEFNDVSKYLSNFHSYDITQPRYIAGSDKHLDSENFDVVIHLAALISVEESTLRPTAYYWTNGYGTALTIGHARCDHFIYASTGAAATMCSPYARSKVEGEDAVKEHHSGYTIFRFYNVSGTNGTCRQLGPATHLIRRVAEVAAGYRRFVTVYGSDYDTRDGTAVRDYVHVEDVARAIVTAVDQGPAMTPYECIGTSHGYSVLEVIDTMSRVTGQHIEHVLDNRRPGDSAILLTDSPSALFKQQKTLEDMCLDQYRLAQNGF